MSAAEDSDPALKWIRAPGDSRIVTDMLPSPPPGPAPVLPLTGGSSGSADDPECRECRPAELALDPASTPGTPGAGRGPPSELVEHAVPRLAILAAVFSIVLTLMIGLDVVLHETLGWVPPPHMATKRVSMGVLIGLSVATFLVAKLRPFSAQRTLDLGLAYEVLGALVIAFPAFYCPEALNEYDLGHTSWLGVWIVLFPLVVPTSPARVAAVGLLAASTGPLVWLVSPLHGPTTFQALLEAFLPAYVAAAMAIMPAIMLNQLGAQVSKARQQLRRLGAYQLVERLGKGGMGEVWRAEHHMLARPAAVKLVRPDVKDPVEHKTALARFEREAKATASLRSPHTVSLYDFGVADDGAFYYVMELLQGVDLETLVAKCGPVSPARAIHLLRQACDSLAEAHAVGLVHRDIKPANISSCRLGLVHDYIKVLDFGLVAKAERSRGQSVRLTGDGFIVGTPAFMAPEMVAGDEVDGRADLYALGCVGYWLVTGRLVFEKENPMQVLIDHARTPPAPPSAKAKQPIPPALDALLLSLLEKDPARRPQDALTLARKLDDLAAQLGERWTPEQARAWWEKHLPAMTAPSVTSQVPTTPPRAALVVDAMAAAR